MGAWQRQDKGLLYQTAVGRSPTKGQASLGNCKKQQERGVNCKVFASLNGLWSYLLSRQGNLWLPGISRAQQTTALQGWASHSCGPVAQSMVATLLAFVPRGGVQELRPHLCSPACSQGRAGGVCTAVPSCTLWGALSRGGGCAAVCLTGTAPAGSDGGQGRRRRRRVSCRAARFPCCAAAPSAGRMGAGCWTRTQGWPSRPCRAAVCHQPNQISRSGEQFSSPWESVRALCWPCMWLPASGMGPCKAWGQRALP